MRTRSINAKNVIIDYGDTDFTKAIESFIDVLNESLSHGLSSDKYSVFSLMKDHLDKPFEKLLGKYGMEKELGFCKPSLYKTPAPNSSFSAKRFESWSISGRIKYALITWERELYDLIHLYFESTSQRFINSLESLRAMVKLLPGLLSGQAEKKYTRYHGIMGSGDDYCYLCWRPVQGETRYCSEHDKSTEKGCKKYNQDRKYLKQFNYELLHWKQPDKTRLPISPEWFLYEAEKLGFGLSVEEIRKVIYFAVRSNLHLKVRRETLKLHLEGFNNQLIAEERGVSKQSVSKTMKAIDEQINNIIHSAEIDHSTEHCDTLVRRKIISARDGKEYETLAKKDDNPKIYYFDNEGFHD